MANNAERVKNTFKDKIDWKFFNYIKDKMTLFEDKNISAIVEVYACLTLRDKYIKDRHTICFYITGFNEESDHWTTFKNVETPVEKIGQLYTEIVYGIFLFDEDHTLDKFGNWTDKYLKEFYETIKNKAILLDNQINGINTHILIQPR